MKSESKEMPGLPMKAWYYFCAVYETAGINCTSNHKEVNSIMAGNLLMSMSKDERERAVFRSRRMYQTDLQSDLATAEDRGEKRGKIEVARNLLGMKLPLDQIIKATGLTHEEIKRLELTPEHDSDK